ncbi:transmembrane emp24 domain-containing protein p24beta3-like isoform X1 [Lolium rigidum]|uniref:transmembrane emp24 domain-containing protein p24beta3-like isoform X1 n=1 Tax=Lolium rigidum TaxID=89674 RepID=UPI001F5DFD5E|nr:transmembrane emp24 domain-containing protein p24beta3-like isoform X1 [Lolium rigidum]
MARGRLAMLLVLAVALLAPAGLQADALSVTVTDTECIDEFVPSEGDSVFGYFVVFNKGISRSSDQRGGIYLTVTSPSGNTVCTLKGNSGEHIDFKAPRGGTYKFCFHNHYGAPATVSLYIHVGRIPNEHNLGKDGHNQAEEAMKKRFQEWMARHHRTYKDEEEKVRRYKLFKDCANRVDKLNALGDGVTYKTNDFCDRSKEEMLPYYSGG